MTSTPAGWYPNGPEWETWWDGAAWTDRHRRVEQSPPPPPPPVAPPEPAAHTDTAPEEGASEEGATDGPSELVGVNGTVRRTHEALVLTASGRMGKWFLGADEHVIPWDELLTVEQNGGVFRVRTKKAPIDVAVAHKNRHLIPAFVQATLAQHAERTGRSAGTGGRLTRAERRDIVTTGVTSLLGQRLPELRAALTVGDVHAEERTLHDLIAFAREKGQKKPESLVEEAHRALLGELGIPARVFVGKWGPLRVFEDRLVNGAEAHLIDQYTEAQVFLDGQKQVTMRPSLTAALLFSPLPGSSLVFGQHYAGKKTHDMRKASMIVGSTDYSWQLWVMPDMVGGARTLAQRINALADATTSTTAPVTAAATQPDVLGQLERVAQMEAAGTITSAQAEALKERLISIT